MVVAKECVNIVVIGYVDSGKPAAAADATENVSADASQVTEMYTRGRCASNCRVVWSTTYITR